MPGTFDSAQDDKMSIQALTAKCSSVFCSEASSATLSAVFERSIWRIRPHNTLPGPTSTNVVHPFFDQAGASTVPTSPNR